MKLTYPILLAVLLQIAGSSCTRDNPRIVHMDFCDFLNSPPDSRDSQPIQERSIHYLVDARDPAGLPDTAFSNYLKRDLFIEQEIRDDILREYHWVRGKYKGYFLFKNGIIGGTEHIGLEKVK